MRRARIIAPGFAAAAPAVLGFARNGAPNTALKASLSRVAAGTGRAKFVYMGDSTGGPGQGGGTGSGNILNARPNRQSAVVASLLTAAGYRTLDNGIVGDHGVGGSGVTLDAYDPRVILPLTPGDAASPKWGVSGGPTFAGGDFLTSPADNSLFGAQFDNVNRFRIVYYRTQNLTLLASVDNAAPPFGPSDTPIAGFAGFGETIVGSTGVGTHTVRIASGTPGYNIAVKSINAFDSTQPAIDQIVHASLGASAADQAASNNSWLNIEALGYEAPDLTIITIGYNDQLANRSFASIQSSLQAIVSKAKASGDALVVVEPKANGNYGQRYAEYRAGMLALGASNNVSTLDLGTATGDADLTSRFADGTVHPNAGLYADIGASIKAAILAMAA